MRFYDLSRNPVVCPSCGAEFRPAALLRTRHNRPLTSEREEHAGLRAPAAAPAVEEIEGDERAPNDDEAGEGGEEHEKEEQKEDVIEDASELGEGADDMTEVIDQVEPDEEER